MESLNIFHTKLHNSPCLQSPRPRGSCCSSGATSRWGSAPRSRCRSSWSRTWSRSPATSRLSWVSGVHCFIVLCWCRFRASVICLILNVTAVPSCVIWLVYTLVHSQLPITTQFHTFIQLTAYISYLPRDNLKHTMWKWCFDAPWKCLFTKASNISFRIFFTF